MISTATVAAVGLSVVALLAGCGSQDETTASHISVAQTAVPPTTVPTTADADITSSAEHQLVELFPSGDAFGQGWEIDFPVAVDVFESTGDTVAVDDPQDWVCDSIPARSSSGDLRAELRASYTLTSAADRVFVLMLVVQLTATGAERYMEVVAFEGDCLGPGTEALDIDGADEAVSFSIDYETLGYEPIAGNKSVVARKGDVVISIMASDEDQLAALGDVVRDAVLRIPDHSESE